MAKILNFEMMFNTVRICGSENYAQPNTAAEQYSVAFSPQANYTDRATATCWRSANFFCG
jgi:hypothetical protein